MDKILKKYLFMTLIFIINFNCATAMSIDEQIEVIKKAPESERVELMNQFKRQLVLMNQQQRESAIYRLKNDKVTNHIEIKSDTFINTMQSSSIEHNLQIAKDIVIQEQIREHTNIPIRPTSIEQSSQTVPTVISPTVTQPQSQPTVTTPTATQPQGQPTVTSPTVTQPQSQPTVTTSTVTQTQGQSTVTTPIVTQPQGQPTVTSPTATQPQGQSTVTFTTGQSQTIPNSTNMQGGFR